jgi:DNA polymerase elongation subunit (family B)
MHKIFLDIETSPLLGYSWELYDTNVLKVQKQRELMSFAYKIDDGRVICHSLRKNSTKELLERLATLLNEADIVIGHNSKAFDIKMINSFLIHEGFTPPKPYKQIDTLQIARSKFRFASNHLNDLGEYLGCGEKVKTGGIDLWFKCMAGNKDAWKKMEEYNCRDVELLEKVYNKLVPWADNTPFVELGMTCPACGSANLERRGWNINKVFLCRRLQCKSCGKWTQSSNKIKHNNKEYAR